MKKAFLITLGAMLSGFLAKAQKQNNEQLLDTAKLLQNFRHYKMDTLLSNKLLLQPLNSNQAITLASVENSGIKISPVDHMPVIAFKSADHMPVKRTDVMQYNMPVKRLGNPPVPLARP